MAEEKLEFTKLRERLQGCIAMVKEEAKKEGIAFDKDIFLEGCKLGESLFIRSEIAFSSKRG